MKACYNCNYIQLYLCPYISFERTMPDNCVCELKKCDDCNMDTVWLMCDGPNCERACVSCRLNTCSRCLDKIIYCEGCKIMDDLSKNEAIGGLTVDPIGEIICRHCNNDKICTTKSQNTNKRKIRAAHHDEFTKNNAILNEYKLQESFIVGQTMLSNSCLMCDKFVSYGAKQCNFCQGFICDICISKCNKCQLSKMCIMCDLTINGRCHNILNDIHNSKQEIC